jgi:hypothetical protein
VVAAPTSGLVIESSVNLTANWPPSMVNAQPAAFTVNTSDAMLKRVRYGAERDCVRKVHWLHALAAATIIV